MARLDGDWLQVYAGLVEQLDRITAATLAHALLDYSQDPDEARRQIAELLADLPKP